MIFSKKQNKLILSLITLLAIFFFAISIFSAETATIEEQIEKLKSIIDSSSFILLFKVE